MVDLDTFLKQCGRIPPITAVQAERMVAALRRDLARALRVSSRTSRAGCADHTSTDPLFSFGWRGLLLLGVP